MVEKPDGLKLMACGVEKADGQGNQAAAKPEGPEPADPAEPREGARESRSMGEQPGAAAPEIGLWIGSMT